MYTKDDNDRWHRDNDQYASNAEMGFRTNDSADFDSSHANSLNDLRTDYGHTLADKATKEILKFG